MKTIVITILDDVCAKNNKDPNAVNLIEVAKTYGKVESLDSVLKAERMQYESTILNMRTQLEACAEHSVTPAELEILRMIRKKSKDECAELEKIIDERDDQLKSIQTEQEARIAQIKSLLGV